MSCKFPCSKYTFGISSFITDILMSSIFLSMSSLSSLDTFAPLVLSIRPTPCDLLNVDINVFTKFPTSFLSSPKFPPNQ